MIMIMTRMPMVALGIYWGWISLNVVIGAVSLADGSMHESMLDAVDYAAKAGAEIVLDRNEMAWRFIYISLLFFGVMTMLGGFLIHQSAKKRRWALVLLVPFALWSAYESISSPFVLGEMYPGKIDSGAWVMGFVGAAVWVLIVSCIAQIFRREHSN